MDVLEDLRMNHEYCPKEVLLAAADEIERLRGDAERYRWLKEHGYANEKNASNAVIGDNKKARVAFRYWCSPMALDELIDAANRRLTLRSASAQRGLTNN